MSVRLFCGDALEVLRTLPDCSVDAVVTDPPYGERNANWDGLRSVAWYQAWMSECSRILKPAAPFVTFAPRRRLDMVMGALRAARGDDSGCPLQNLIWVHRQGHTSRDGFLRPEHEVILVSGLLRTKAREVRKRRRYTSPHNVARMSTMRRSAARGFKPTTYLPDEDGPMGGTVFICGRNKPGEASGHPTQKPLRIVEYLVFLASAPGEILLDPFMGSGTTGIVAARSGRDFIGIDLSPKYVEMAQRRIDDTAPLFAEVSP